MGVEILNTSFATVGDDEVVSKNVLVEDGGYSTVALGELTITPAYWSPSTGFQKITVVCDKTASHDLDRCMASMSMHKNKTRGPSSINGLHVDEIGDHGSDCPQVNNDQGSSTSIDGLHAISNGVHVGMGSKPSTNKQTSEQLLIMVGLID
ncbi:hypothetical protein L1987_49252 [Smallanthus sonchifolius]|uniref:Uncharacterized protein n=1 Tax=Smallanthus sonchifolius TaxID=185202 RepID=A0ACB9FU00_9ASTR|nr:hypothetical protein L1987_49252 [Smallanthus sonchifolius]